jgi:CheY-like chemotaxis protein
MSKPITCFLIDDDADDQEIFELALKSVDPTILFNGAGDGVEAVQKLQTEQTFAPDFIFLDLNMPRMDGKECLRELRKIDRLKDTPIIIYSTSTDERDRVETKALGADHYLEKQSSIKVLKSKLTEFFNR